LGGIEKGGRSRKERRKDEHFFGKGENQEEGLRKGGTN